LTGAALDHWGDTAAALIRSGRLRSTSVTAYGVLCGLAVDCETLAAAVESEGQVLGGRANPKVRLLRDARRDYLIYAKAFGLDPASEARLPAQPAAPPADPLEEYLKLRHA